MNTIYCTMARTNNQQHPIHNHHQLIALLLSFVAALVLLPQTTAGNGFSLELIHRDSIHSPLYPGNLTDDERLRRLANFSESRAQWLKSSALRPQDLGIRPTISNDLWMYMVRVGIGSPPIFLHLFLDTGSDIIWTQSSQCHPCFHQLPPIFDPTRSQTYRPLPRNHPLCIPPGRGVCRFDIRYGDGSYTRGVFATEHFTFNSRSGRSESIRNVVFGCSHETSDNMFTDRPQIGGILGMNGGLHSFVMQLAAQTQRRFSYCLTPITQQGSSYLRFGTDIPIVRNAQRTPFLVSETGTYHLELLDISINNRRLNFPPWTFRRRSDGTGGCFIDSGSSLTHLVSTAYNVVKADLMRYFARYNLRRIPGGGVGVELCYSKPPDFVAYPTIVFHFRGADLRLEPLNAFYVHRGNTAFCLMMKSADDYTLIGSILQQNIRFIYDIGRQQLIFTPENCARN